jgi:poly [ADP-ribose] polymerase 2/3/4
MSKKHKKTSSDSPIPEPLSVDYAPTGRAMCKKCQTPIGDNTVRVGRLVRSRFHDGFDTQLYHWRCGRDYGNSIDDYRGWPSLRWNDIEKLAGEFGDELLDVAQEYRKRSDWISTAAMHLENVPAALLRQVFEANDLVVSDRAKAADLARIIADNILFGKFAPCPTCNTKGLRQEGADVRCHGWFSASTKCDFKFRLVELVNRGTPVEAGKEVVWSAPVGDELMTGRVARVATLIIPEDVAQHKSFKTLIVPKELRKELAKLSGGKSAKGGGVSSSVIATLDSEEESADGLEASQIMLGMKIVFAGLDREEVEFWTQKIHAFGGMVHEDVIPAGPDRTTHLVIAEDEIFRDPKSSRYRRSNDAGIPIVKLDFLEAFRKGFEERDMGGDDNTCTALEVTGRSKKEKNAIINGIYELVPDLSIADRSVFKKAADEKKSCPELFLFYSASRSKWKLAPSVDDGKGHLAINPDAKAERPDKCSKAWEIFGGKENGFTEDKNVVVRSRGVKRGGMSGATDSSGRPVGVSLRQRKNLKFYVVEGSLGKKLPSIKECLLSSAATKSGKKKRFPPLPGTPIVTVDEEASGEYRDAGIFVDASNNVYNVLLTKTDATSNVNKFYAIQLVSYLPKKSSTPKNYAVFRKWGRFGYTGNTPMNGSMSVDFGTDKSGAIEAFRGKFNECTGLDFDLRDVAPQKPGRYAFVELQGQPHEATEKIVKKNAKKNPHVAASKLPKELAELMDLIFDFEMIEREMRTSMDIDTSRLPPSALSKRQLAQGLAVLLEVEKILMPFIEEGVQQEQGGVDGPTKDLKLRDCSSRFFTIVPHAFDRKEAVPIIDSVKRLTKLIRNMEDLMQIVELEQIRANSISKQNEFDKPLPDMQYEELGCTLSHVQRGSTEFALITRSIMETHAETHNTYTIEVDKIFKVQRPNERDRFCQDPAYSADQNRLLWHGSRMSNWAGILKNGLKIAPKEAPVTGYMFGKGVYFADCSSKSANYCFASEEEPDGLLVLCDVALGNQYKRLESQYEAATKCKKKGCDSTWGVGQHAPSSECVLPDGTKLPAGKLEPNTNGLEIAKEHHPRGKPTLLYNEFIVYRESQFEMKYVVHVKFNFKK